MQFLKESKERIRREYNELLKVLPQVEVQVNDLTLEEEEKLAMQYLYSIMPYSDAGNYTTLDYLDYARHGVYLWKTYSHVKELPEDIYLNYCLHYRVNTEEIRPCRSLFYEQLKTRVEGLSMKDTILEINYWCGEQVTYQASDARTLSALAVYERGYGRCGEESTFAVNVYRSMGIPARQVYTPLWAHCDDNHAWIEVWLEGEWFFLGACEPEPVLNKGWFTNASSRAMLIHSRIFDIPPVSEPSRDRFISRSGVVTILNELKRYADCTEICVKVFNESMEPAVGVRVIFEIINYAQLAPIASMITDDRGEVCFTTGLGSIHILAIQHNLQAEAYLNTKDSKEASLVLAPTESKMEIIRVDMIAPAESRMHAVSLGREVQEAHLQRLETVTRLRKERSNGLKNTDYIDFLEQPEDAMLRNMLAGVISSKDKTDVKRVVLEDHLAGAAPFMQQYPQEIFTKYLLNPRVENEVLTAYRESVCRFFTKEEQASFRSEPQSLWNYIEQEIPEVPEKDNEDLVTAPAVILRLKKAGMRSKKVLFVAAARSLGIPARLDEVYGDPQYYMETGFITVAGFSNAGMACLTLENGDDTVWKYEKNYTIARLDGEQYQALPLEEAEWEGNHRQLTVKSGYYRIVTANRLPNGNIFAYVSSLYLGCGECKTIKLNLRTAELEDMQVCFDLSDFEFVPQTGKKQLIMFLDAGKEPTEHILNEMLEQSSEYKKYETQITFYIKDTKDLEQVTLHRTLQTFPEILVKTNDFSRLAEAIGRRMYVDFENMPVIAAVDEKRNGIYAVSGYQVGTGDILLRLMKE